MKTICDYSYMLRSTVVNMCVKSVLFLVACLVTGEAFFLNANRRDADDVQSRPVEDNANFSNDVQSVSVEENVPMYPKELRCVIAVYQTCPQFEDFKRFAPKRRGEGIQITEENHLRISCSQETLATNRQCAARAKVGCEDNPRWADGPITLWEDLCHHEQAFVENKECISSPAWVQNFMECVSDVRSQAEACATAPGCLRTATASQCSTDFGALVYGIAKNATDIYFGRNCDDIPAFMH